MIDNKICLTKEVFIEELGKYKGVVLFLGHGSKNQYEKKQLNQLKKKLDGIVEIYNSKFNHHWIAIYGGDKDQGEENPDIGYLMSYLNHHHQIPLGMVTESFSDKHPILDDKNDGDNTHIDWKKSNHLNKKKKFNLVHYTKFEKDQNNQILYGGFHDGRLVGATKVYLGDELIKPSSSSDVLLCDIISFGGGNIAFQEVTYAFENRIPITYVPAEIGHQNHLESNLLLQKYGPIYEWAIDHKQLITISPLEQNRSK